MTWATRLARPSTQPRSPSTSTATTTRPSSATPPTTSPSPPPPPPAPVSELSPSLTATWWWVLFPHHLVVTTVHAGLLCSGGDDSNTEGGHIHDTPLARLSAFRLRSLTGASAYSLIRSTFAESVQNFTREKCAGGCARKGPPSTC